MSQQFWRLVITSPLDGAMNMAIDHAILEAVAAGEVPPTLRLYAWRPACLSLGYGQPFADVDTERLGMFGWDVVRRMTGGRAILHADELTYSVALPAGHTLVAGDIVSSYRRLSAALVTGLRMLGVTPQADKCADNPTHTGPVCFEVPSHYEITCQGKKLIGSAQVRKFGGVLQHGTIPLDGDITRIVNALAFPDEAHRESARAKLRRRALTLSEVLGRAVSWEEAAAVVTRGFQHTFDVIFETQGLSPEELARAESLQATQYAADTWTRRH